MYTIKNSRHFKPYQDPVTGAVSYILKNEIAPLQQSFYFVNPSMSNDGRYYWFYCAFPPSGSASYGRTLGVVDFLTDEVRYFPDTMFVDASPMVDGETGEVYWCNKRGIYKRSADPAKEAECVARLPKMFTETGELTRVTTHLTFSADRSELLLDLNIGHRSVIASVKVATQEFEIWGEFDHFRDGCFDHAQFNPVDKDLVLCAHEFWSDLLTGERHGIYVDETGRRTRTWTLRRGEKPVCWKSAYPNGSASHEWWSADGKSFFYIDLNLGMVKFTPETGVSELTHPGAKRHGHCTADEKYYVGDDMFRRSDGLWYRGCESLVCFRNGETGKMIDVISNNPSFYTPEDPCTYHIDPHPQFVGKDRYIAFTTTVYGKVTAGIADVEDLAALTR